MKYYYVCIWKYINMNVCLCCIFCAAFCGQNIDHIDDCILGTNKIWSLWKYSRTCLERPPHWPKNIVSQYRWSLVTGSIAFESGPSVRKTWSFNTGGLSWQWYLKDRFHCTYVVFIILYMYTGSETEHIWLRYLIIWSLYTGGLYRQVVFI